MPYPYHFRSWNLCTYISDGKNGSRMPCMLWHFSLATSARASFRALELVGGCCQLFLIAICFRQFDCKDVQGRCQRFCQTCIVQNPQLASTSANLKSSFGAMFKRTCPLFIETRWNWPPGLRTSSPAKSSARARST